MTTCAPCPVCGKFVLVSAMHRIGPHWAPDASPKRGTPECPGSGALAPAADLLAGPIMPAPDPGPAADMPPHAPAFQLDAFDLDLFGGPQS